MRVKNFKVNVHPNKKTEFTLPDLTDISSETPKLTPKLEQLKNSGNEAFREGEYWHAEQLYNYALYRCRHNHPILLANSSAALVERKFPSDLYHAFRQAKRALEHVPHYTKCRRRAIKVLKEMQLWPRVIDEYGRVLSSGTDLDDKMRRECRNGIDMAKEAEERRQATWGNTTVDSRLADIDAFLARHCDYKHRFAGHANSETDIKVS